MAVVTGGSRGIGAETCRAFAANGARVVVSGRDGAAIDAVVADIRADGGTAVGVAADVTSLESVRALRAGVEREYGPADVLLAFAGGSTAPPAPLVDMTEADFRSAVDGNLLSTFFCLKVFLPPMLDRGSGSVVTMASAAARYVSRGPIAYAAAKAGVLTMTRQVARDVAASGVRVNAVAPASIGTDRVLGAMSPEILAQAERAHPVGRIGTPADVANAALYLASDASAFLTGVTLDVAGGMVMR
ncbi:SDR family oxidoreductase [Actinocatenispora rupis]|uniref:Oxidoreductase n=1 Tax=Actinocatenispora rupis TaxID=519421 RepID=A0A8J3N8S2_9ACTN|nr:oxidoreductase [Actinocatenispora rupis]